MRPNTQPIRLIHQEIDPLPPLQHPLNILRHDAPHIINLLLRVRDGILLPALGRPIPHHQLLQTPIEVRRSVGRQRCKVRAVDIVAGEKLLFDFNEIAKRDPAAETAGGDDEVGEAAGGGGGGGVFRGRVGDVVDEVLVVGVGELLWGGVGDFGEDEGGERGGLGGGGGGVFG